METVILTDPAATSIVVPMGIQPESGESVVYSEADKRWMFRKTNGGFYITPPLRVGDVIPVREQWRVRMRRLHSVIIEYRDGSTAEVNDSELTEWPENFRWQPASTMPDGAARQHRRVCAVEWKWAGQLNYSEFVAAWQEDLEDSYVWLITLDTVYRDGDDVKVRRVKG